MAVRAHYAPVFSRLGPYDRDVLDRAAWSHSARSPRLLVEYWAHEAALMAVDDWPLLRWRMREYTHGRWGTQIVKKNPRLADDIVAAVEELGPSTAGQIEAHLGAEQRGKKGPWWDRSDTKWVTEALFAAGVLTTATRVGFARALRPHRERAAAGGRGPRGRRRRSAAGTDAAGRQGARVSGPRPTFAITSASAPSKSSLRSPSWSPTESSNPSTSTAGMRRRICGPARPCPAGTGVRRCCARSIR